MYFLHILFLNLVELMRFTLSFTNLIINFNFNYIKNKYKYMCIIFLRNNTGCRTLLIFNFHIVQYKL